MTARGSVLAGLRSVTGHRLLVTILVGGLLGVIWVTAPALRLLPEGLEDRFVVGPLTLIYAGYAGVLAAFVGWRVAARSDGRRLSLMLAFYGFCLALSVTPSGEPGVWRRAAFGVFWMAAIVQSIRFWIVFPTPLSAGPVRELRRGRRSSVRWLLPLNHLTAWTVEVVLDRTWGKALLALFAVGFTWFLVGSDVQAYNIMRSPVPPNASPFRFVLALAGTATILAIFAFAWTGFRMADEQGRRRALWIVLAYIVIAGVSVITVTLAALTPVTSSEVLDVMRSVLDTVYHPVITLVNLTGFALAVFYSGALDLRPVITRTTLYGGLVLVLTVVFAIVEETVEVFVETRLNLPDGIGSWTGAAAIALAMGPLHGKLKPWIQGLARALEPEAAREPEETRAGPEGSDLIS